MTWHNDFSFSLSLWIHTPVYLFFLYCCLRLCLRCRARIKVAPFTAWPVLRTIRRACKSKVLLSQVSVVCKSSSSSFLLGLSSLHAWCLYSCFATESACRFVLCTSNQRLQ